MTALVQWTINKFGNIFQIVFVMSFWLNLGHFLTSRYLWGLPDFSTRWSWRLPETLSYFYPCMALENQLSTSRILLLLCQWRQRIREFPRLLQLTPPRTETGNNTQWSGVKLSNSRLRGPGFEFCAVGLKPWASFFTQHCSNSFSCMNVYLVIDSGGICATSMPFPLQHMAGCFPESLIEQVCQGSKV